MPRCGVWDTLISIHHGNETFEIAPGESMYVEILVMDFDMVKDGIYRLTFGDAVIDFELEWEMVW